MNDHLQVTTTAEGGDPPARPHDKLEKPKNLAWGRGIVYDFKSTVGTHWWEEMTNFNQRTVATVFFMFFALETAAFTFGAMYSKVTGNYIGVVEMLIAKAWAGIFFALVGGQPMMINGGTGPVMSFMAVLYKMSETMDFPFLPFQAWTGLWVCFYMFVAAFIDLNRIIRYCTRFTDEIFSMLIAAIFIIDALGSPFAPVGVLWYFDPNHKSHQYHYEDNPDEYSHEATAVLSLMLCLATCSTALMLRQFKFSPFCCNQTMRNTVTDFGVVTSIVLYTLLDSLVFKNIPTEKLNVPHHIEPTFTCCDETCHSYFPDDCPELEVSAGPRPWLVDLLDLNGKMYVPFLAACPAFLAFILIFLDDGITKHLINHPCHKLKHGDAYNYDTIIVGLMIAVNSMVGMPWLVAATVRSMTHINAMAEKDEKGRFISVQETRLTALFVHILMLISAFAISVLKLIPMPVLYGVFLYMGISSLGTNQFWGRFLMFFMQPLKFPKMPFTENGMTTKRMHLFTFIQVLLFAAMYVVKTIKLIAIAFPIVIALCIPIRLYILPKIFTDEELMLIDTDEETVQAWLSTLSPEDLDPERPQPTFNFDACNFNKPPRPLNDDDDDENVSLVSAPGGIENQPENRAPRRERHKQHSHRGRGGGSARQDTANTVTMDQDDDELAAFFDNNTGAQPLIEMSPVAAAADATTVRPMSPVSSHDGEGQGNLTGLKTSGL